MADYRLSRLAATDLEAIAAFSIDCFEFKQARRYQDQLIACFSNLVANPSPDRRAEQLAKGLRRFEHGSHIIFYKREGDDVFVVRVLHYRTDAGRHL
ncbi:MAG: type II toxin-antitoxin system RelE/ParE family toxin [Gammaproteobacteria bacterium]|nr:type II toxin-antitoxin system RelE/ParE family toxin [Gammaproteobacteria bacterium]